MSDDVRHREHTKALLRATSLEVGYGREAILPPLDFAIRPRQQWALIGPNGAGKTTLLRTMLHLLPPIAGSCETPRHLATGYVPQRASIDPGVPARVHDIVRLGVDREWSFLSPRHASRRADAVERALVDTDCVDLARQQFRELSEGQRQRVLIARALASDPSLLILDEPTASMDLRAERTVFELLERLRRARDIAVVLVSHQLSLAAKFATHGIIVDKESRHAAVGPIAELAAQPETIARYGKLFVRAVLDEHASSEAE